MSDWRDGIDWDDIVPTELTLKMMEVQGRVSVADLDAMEEMAVLRENVAYTRGRVAGLREAERLVMERRDFEEGGMKIVEGRRDDVGAMSAGAREAFHFLEGGWRALGTTALAVKNLADRVEKGEI